MTADSLAQSTLICASLHGRPRPSSAARTRRSARSGAKNWVTLGS